MQVSLTSVLSLTRLHPRKSMLSITRFGRPPRSFWPQVATAVAALLLSGAACADMAGGLLVSPTSLNFGSVALGATSASQQVTVTNTTSAPIGPLSVGSGVSAPWGSGTGCSGVTLAAGTSCSSTYTFTPTALGPQVSSAEGITINGVKVPMSFVGTGVQGLRVTPTSFNFGDVIVNTTSPGQVLTVTNITSAPATIASSSAGAMAPFAYSGNCPGITLASGASCTYTYTFLPTTLGARATPAGTEFVVNGQATPISLQGTGVASIPPGSLLVTPSELNFGDVPIGATSAPQSTTLTNISGLTVPISFISGALPGGEFGGGTATNNCGPALAAGASCVLSTYTFSPTSAGAQTGSVTETVNSFGHPLVVKGNGVSGLNITPSIIDFGPIPVGATSAPQSTTLTNISGLTVPISFISGALPGGEFGGGTATNNCGPALAAGASCVLSTYTFSPTSAGAQTGSVTETVNSFGHPLVVKGIGTTGAPLVPPTITSVPPPGGSTGTPYNFIVTATGTTAFTFSDAGTLPPGLTINPSTGAITGTPSAAGSYNVTLAAANGILPNGAQAFTMDIALAPVGSVTAVPTLGEWGLLLMACLVGGTGWWQVRRRSTSRWPAP